jgi:hypothetical protein
MSDTFNIYCDESGHLEHDGIPFMVLGLIWCQAEKSREAADRIREIKSDHELLDFQELQRTDSRPFESKWTKVSPAKSQFYVDLVDYFFDNDYLHFRCILIEKCFLDHVAHEQTHDEWYYKMLFRLLEPTIDPNNRYRIYLDIKDTRSELKRATLERFLRSKRHDRDGSIVERVQQIRSHESELLQVTGLLIGAVGYYNRMRAGDLPKSGESLNQGKVDVIHRIQHRSHKSLDQSTWTREAKFNIFRWHAHETHQ